MSNDLRNIGDFEKDLLLNKNLIAVNQDPLGTMATKLFEVMCFYCNLYKLWYLIASIPDLCRLSFFYMFKLPLTCSHW